MRVSFAHHTKINSPVRDKQAWTPCGSFYHSRLSCLVDVAITVLVLDHSIANEVVHQILSREDLIRIQQEFF